MPELRALLPADASIRLAGSADRLAEVRNTMGMNFVLALLVLFLLMTALFKSLKDSLFVMLALPMALLGGVLGLRLLGLFVPQPLDLLSMHVVRQRCRCCTCHDGHVRACAQSQKETNE